LRNRAAQTLGLFVTVLFVAILLALPGQSERALGGELVALAPAAGTLLYVLIAPVLVALAGGVTSAWLFLTMIDDAEAA
jgi:hypothetical protein